jgi:hypothetical protein
MPCTDSSPRLAVALSNVSAAPASEHQHPAQYPITTAEEIHMSVAASSVEYSVGWFTLALINAGLAQGKGRSGRNWFLLSVLLGPVATLALLFREKL